MSSSRSLNEHTDAVDRARRKKASLLLVLAVGVVMFCAAAGTLYYVLLPVTLRVAVGPAGSDDHKVVFAMAQVFAAESRTVRLTPVTTEGAVEALALLKAGKADLAVARGDLEMSADAQTLAVLRKNYAVLWSTSGLPGKSSKSKHGTKVEDISGLAGRKIGVIGRTPANPALLRVILTASGVEADKASVMQFGTDNIEELARDPTLDAFLAVGPLDSKITADAISATARMRGAPKFLGLEASEALALKNPRYEAEEIPPSVFNAKPAWPNDKVDTISVSHLIVARKVLSESTAAAFFGQLFATRELIVEQAPGAAHITKPDLEKNAQLSVHRGAASVINGTERTFLDKYGDYFWFALLLLSGIGSAAAWLKRYLNRDERKENTKHRNQILMLISEVHIAGSEQQLLQLQRDVDAIVGETLHLYDEGSIEEGELAPLSLAIELFNHAMTERRAALQIGPIEPTRGSLATHRLTSPPLR